MLRGSYLLLTGMVLLGVVWFLGSSRKSGSLEPLSTPWIEKILDLNRLLEPRLTGYGYSPFKPDESKALLDAMDPMLLVRTKASFEEVRAWHSPREAVQAKAHWLLMFSGEPEAIREAIEELESLLLEHPDDPHLHNDLATAFYLRAITERRPYFFLNALEHIDQAHTLNPNLEEAHFNLALILEALFLNEAAETTWRTFIKNHPGSAWFEEARTHLDKLITLEKVNWDQDRTRLLAAADDGNTSAVTELTARHPAQVRRFLENKLFRNIAGENRGSVFFHRARMLAAALEANGGGSLYVEAIKQFDLETDGVWQLALIAFRDAMAMKNEDQKQARAFLQTCIDLLGDNPFSLRARFHQGVFYSWERNSEKARVIFTSLMEPALGAGYTNLVGELFWMIGNCDADQAVNGSGLQAYQESLAIFESLDDLEKQLGVYNLILTAQERMGKETWQTRHQMLALLPRISNPVRHYDTYWGAAYALDNDGRHKLASYFWKQVSRIAPRIDDPLFVLDALYQNARNRNRIGMNDEARAAMAEAKKLMAHVASLDNDSNRAEALTIEAEILMEQEPGKSAELFSRAGTLHDKRGFRLHRASILFAEAMAHLNDNERGLAERALANCIATLEDESKEYLEPHQRITFFQRIHGTYDEMIHLQLEAGQVGLAFDYLEAGKARVLLDQIQQVDNARDNSSPLLENSRRVRQLEELQINLPANTVIITYHYLEENLYVWVLSSKSIEKMLLAEDTEALAVLLNRLRNMIRRTAPEKKIKVVGSELYQLLVAPFENSLDSARRLVFVAGGPLRNLPFAALYIDGRNQYLVEAFDLAVGPSANCYIQSVMRDREFDTPVSLEPLVVGNPHFNRGTFPHLENLTHAEEEARRVGSHYGQQAVLIIGEEANREALLNGIRTADIFHFAGHAEINLKNPYDSALIVAGKDRENSVITARTLYQQVFPKTRLVVLSACETSGGTSLQNEGVASLARPFLAIGTPAVVASLWETRDQANSELFDRFYGALTEGREASAALRQAQIQMIHGDDPDLATPSAWAAFQCLGYGFGGRDAKTDDEKE